MYSQSFAVYSFMVVWLQLWVCNSQSFNWWKCPEFHHARIMNKAFERFISHHTVIVYDQRVGGHQGKTWTPKVTAFLVKVSFVLWLNCVSPPVFPFWIIHSPCAVNKHWDSGVCLIMTARWWWNIEDLESPEFCAARIHFHLPPTWLVAELITKVTDGWGNGTFFPLRDSRN